MPLSGELSTLAGAVLLAAFCNFAVAAEPVPAGPPPAVQTAPAQLDILEFVVDGNTVLDEAAIVDTLQIYLGPGRSPEDIDEARAALEKVYRDRGYKTVSVSIPRQTVREGVVQLQVTEGRIARLNVVGSQYHSLDLIREQATSVAEGTVPDFDEIRDNLVALNQQADRRITPALKAGATPGTVDIDLAVSDDLPLHGLLELNNRRSQGTSALRSLGTLSYANLWQRGHSVSLSYQTAPQNTDDAKVIFGSYLVPFYGSPFSLLFNALRSDSDVATVGDVNVLGKGRTFGIRGLWNLPGDEEFYHSFSLGVDYKRYRTSVLFGESDLDTPLEYYPFTLGYTSLLRRAGVVRSIDVDIKFASAELGSDFQEVDLNRPLGRGQQFAMFGGFSFTKSLPRGLEMLIRLNGQWTDQLLFTNEQFSAGGADTVRGYFESESLGDYGYSQTLEVRAPPLTRTWLDELQFYVFLDDAMLKIRSPTAGTPGTRTLISTGAGFNIRLLSSLNGTVSWAVPLDDGPFTQSGASRVLFRISGSF